MPTTLQEIRAGLAMLDSMDDALQDAPPAIDVSVPITVYVHPRQMLRAICAEVDLTTRRGREYSDRARINRQDVAEAVRMLRAHLASSGELEISTTTPGLDAAGQAVDGMRAQLRTDLAAEELRALAVCARAGVP